MSDINNHSQQPNTPREPSNSASEQENANSTSSLNGRALAVPHEREFGDSLDLKDAGSRATLEKILLALTQDHIGGGDEKVTSHFTLMDYVAILRRRWLPMLLVFVATAGGLTWLLKPGLQEYSATSTMLLPFVTNNASSSEMGDPLNSPVSSAVLGTKVDTKIAIVTSPPLVRQGLEKLDEKTKIAGWGNANPQTALVSASDPVSSDLINITVTANDPAAAIKLANVLVDVYAQHTKEMVRDSYKDSLELIAGQKKEAEELLFKAKRELQDFKERSGTLNIETQLSATAQDVAELEKTTRAAQLQAASGANNSTVQSDTLVVDLKQKVTTARSKYQTLLADLFPDAPEVVRARRELEEAQGALDKRIAELQSGAQQHAALLQNQLAEARIAAGKLPATEFKLSQLTSKVKLIEATYDALSDRYTATSLGRYNKVDTATVMTPATIAKPVGRTWSYTIVMALLCATVLAGSLAALLEQLDNSIHSTEQLEKIMRTPIVGTLPLINSAENLLLAANAPMDKGSVGATKSLTTTALKTTGASDEKKMAVSESQSSPAQSLLLEACRFMRTNLAFSSVDNPLRSILVTSADSGEGKSFCARNLASIMAYDGKKVILVDCDLRRPVQHRLSGKPLTPGFTNVVLEPHLLDKALNETNIPSLRLLTAGAIPPNPPELLGSELTHNLIAELQKRCDFLIIDSPPALSLTDASVLSPLVDGVLMVVGANSTSVQHIQHAQSNIRYAGGRLLGAIFNKVRPQNDPYGYHGYYKYGAYHYHSYDAKEE